MELFNRLESQYGLPPGLLDSVWSAESSRGQNMRSPAGAQGHFQFMPATAKQYGVADPHDLTQSAVGAARMFADLIKTTGGDVGKALAGYNWGIGNVQRQGMNAAPLETRNYIQKVTAGMGQPQNDSSSAAWDALDQQFKQGTPKQQAGSDPWDALDAQFAQPQATPKATQKAAQVAPEGEPAQAGAGIVGGLTSALSRGLSRVMPFAGMAQPMHAAGMDVAAAKGAASGFADFGNTLLNAATGGVNALVGPDNPVSRWNAERQAGLQDFNRENDSVSFGVGRLGANIAATAPVGGVLGGAVRGAGALPGMTRAVPVLDALGNSIASGGFRTGAAPGALGGLAGDIGARLAGGAIAGGASAGLIDPSSAGVGAGVGAVLPLAFRAAGKGADLASQGARAVFKPEQARAAESILQAGGYKTPQQIAEVRAALAAQGPNIVAEAPTVPQILQNPGISQLQRTLRNSGETSLLEREAAQNAARLAALDRVSPVNGTVQQAAENFGNGLTAAVIPAEKAAGKQVRAAFDAVDPFNETRMGLPIERMQAARDKFLGPGTFGAGSKADAAIAEAQRIGTETLPAVKPQAAPSARGQGEDLVSAIKGLGGIKQDSPGAMAMAGEIRDLKQGGTGMRAVIQNGRGQSPDTLAQAMHARGFIEDDDPATLLNALREHASGNKVFAVSSERGGAMRAGLEGSMGDAPGATVIPKMIPFQQVQNLRSSLGEAADQLAQRGGNREAAALRQMVDDLDARARSVMQGKGEPGEFFPPDVVQAWEKAIAIHAAKMQTFHTGPQASMFRRGGDGLPAAQGAELAPKFFSPRLSQSNDIQGFKRVANPETTGLLKGYAIADLANQTDRLGRLSNAKYQNWMDQRSGAINGLFAEPERATLGGVGKDLMRADTAQSLGMAVGSNTAQNVQDALGMGLLDNPALKILANRTPFVGRFTGPMLDSLRETAKRGKVQKLGGLLADPVELDRAIAESLSRSVRRPGLLANDALLPLLLRTSPLLTTDR